MANEYQKGYGKRPLWQWIVIYLIIGGIIYAIIYYFFMQGRYNTSTPSPTNLTTPRSSY